MIRKIASTGLLAGAVIVGMLTHAGEYLLAFAPPVSEDARITLDDATYADPGTYSVGMRRLDVVDQPTGLLVWYPATDRSDNASHLSYAHALSMFGSDNSTALATYGGSAEPGAAFDGSHGPFPVVVLSHGFAVAASTYAWLGEHLASYGLVVIAPHHQESLDPNALWRSTVDRPRDIASVLSLLNDRTQLGELTGLIDSDAVAVIGHSYGGYTALAAAGAGINSRALNIECDPARGSNDSLLFLCDSLMPHLDDMAERVGLDHVPDEFWPNWSHSGVDAVVTMAGDAAMFGAEGLARVNVPVMAIGGTADTDSPFEWGTRFTFDHVSSNRKVEVALEGATHFIFTGQCDRARRILDLVSLGFCSDELWERSDAHDIVKHFVTAFLLSEFKDQPAAEAILAPGRQDFFDVAYRAEGY